MAGKGRPRKYKTQDIIEAVKKYNGLIYLAAKSLGCGSDVIYDRMKTEPEIKQIVDDCRATLVDLSEHKLKDAIMNGEPWALAMVLKTLGRERGYADKVDVNGTGEIVVRVVHGSGS